MIIPPFVLCVVSIQYHLASRPRLSAALAGVLMIHAVPSFDINPFSYVRIAGLLLLLLITNPGLLLDQEMPGK